MFAAALVAIATGFSAAQSAWGPGCGRVDVRFYWQPDRVVAYVPSGLQCQVFYNLEALRRHRFTAAQLCRVSMHEAGHLRGKKHSSNPRSVMYAHHRTHPMPRRCAALARRR